MEEIKKSISKMQGVFILLINSVLNSKDEELLTEKEDKIEKALFEDVTSKKLIEYKNSLDILKKL